MKRLVLLAFLSLSFCPCVSAATCKDLAGLPRLDNAKTLLHFGGKYTVTVSEWEFIRLALKRYHELSWSKACSGDYGLRGREILCSLALKGYLTVHMDSPMNSTTRFFARRGGL